MKRRLSDRKGTITLFLCIVLSAAIILESIYIKGAYRRKQEVILASAVSHQTEQILSQFDRQYLDWYGIYALDSIESDHAVRTDKGCGKKKKDCKCGLICHDERPKW